MAFYYYSQDSFVEFGRFVVTFEWNCCQNEFRLWPIREAIKYLCASQHTHTQMSQVNLNDILSSFLQDFFFLADISRWLLTLFVYFFVFWKTGVIASGNFNGNNGSIAFIENSTSFTNNSHFNGTINELVASKTIHNDDDNAEHVVAASLSSLSLTRDNISSSGGVPSIDDALNRETTAQAATATIVAASSTPPSLSSSSLSNVETIHTTIASLTDGENTSRMQTSQFIVSSNTRRDSPSTSSTLPITTNKPREYMQI